MLQGDEKEAAAVAAAHALFLEKEKDEDDRVTICSTENRKSVVRT